jgi:replicative DNA helicase
MELFNVEAEQAIIGVCIQFPDKLSGIISALSSSMFYKEKHKHIFKSICELSGRRENVDLITLIEELRKNKLIDLVGGAVALSEMSDNVPSGSNVNHYINIVREMFQRRSIESLARNMIDLVSDPSSSVDSMMSMIDSKCLEIVERKTSDTKHISEFGAKVFEELEEDRNRKGGLKGIPTGLKELDILTCGLRKQSFIVIGARPGTGKSTIEFQMAVEAALMAGYRVGFFSAEMSGTQLIRKMTSNVSGVSGSAVDKWFLTHVQEVDYLNAIEKLFQTNIYINETSNIGIAVLESEARRMKKNFGIDILFIDYLGLIKHPENIDRWRQMVDISQRLKALAKELDIPVVCASQLTREADKREPIMSDLAESKQIEADADVIIFLHQPEKQEENRAPDEDEIVLIVAKNRPGQKGRFRVMHKKAIGRMVQIDHDGSLVSLDRKMYTSKPPIRDIAEPKPSNMSTDDIESQDDLF